jgi:RNA polymerase sigma factor (sigma-70 family)
MAPNHTLDLPTLVRAAAAGDDAAWTKLVAHVTPMLRRAGAGFRLRREDLEDAIQNTWLQAFAHLSRLREPEALVSWLVVTVRREALRTLQIGVREILTEDSPIPAGTDPDIVEDIVVQRERAAAVRTALTRLPARQRTLLERMIDAPGARYGEIAEHLEMPIGSIGPTRERALVRLREDDRLADFAA